MSDNLYFVAFKSGTMNNRSKVTYWLKLHGAVNLFGNNWLLKSEYPFAGDIKHQIELYEGFEGEMIVFNLYRSTGWAHTNISEEAKTWIRENLLGPRP